MPSSSLNWMQTSALLCSGVGLLCTGRQLPNFLPGNEGSGFCKQFFTVLGGSLGPRGAKQITTMATVTWAALQTVEQLGCLWHSGAGGAVRSTQSQPCCHHCCGKGRHRVFPGRPRALLVCVWHLCRPSEQPVKRAPTLLRTECCTDGRKKTSAAFFYQPPAVPFSHMLCRTPQLLRLYWQSKPWDFATKTTTLWPEPWLEFGCLYPSPNALGCRCSCDSLSSVLLGEHYCSGRHSFKNAQKSPESSVEVHIQ